MRDSVNIDLEMSHRVTVGSMFRPSSRDAQTVELLLQGRLTLSPHPEQCIQQQVDWDADPLADRNWRAQLNMLRWIDPLRREEAHGNAAAGQRWLEITGQWIDRNLDPSAAADSAWMDMVDGIRARTLIAGLDLVARVDPGRLGYYEEALIAHGEWLADARNHGHSNHLLHQFEALVAIGWVVGRADWREAGVQGALNLFREQYDHEGVNAEGAVGYHLNNYKWWREAQQILFLNESGKDDPFELLDRTGLELAHATQPDGTLAPIGNTGVVRAVDRGNKFLDFVNSDGARGAAPDELIALYSSGYIYGRSGWGEHERPMSEETFFSLLFGRNDRVHGHVDSGSLTFYANGSPWLVDPGKYSYDGGSDRAHFNRRDAHNVLVVRDRFHDRRVPVELVRHTITSEYADFVLVDKGYKDVRIERRVVYSTEGEFMVVIDTVNSEREVTAYQSWQLSPEADSWIDGNRVNLASGSKNAVLAMFGIAPNVTAHRGETEPLVGWVASGWRRREAATQIRAERTGTKFRFVTVISAGFRDQKPVVSNVSGLPRGAVGFDVSTGRIRQRIVVLRERVLTGPVGWLPKLDDDGGDEVRGPVENEEVLSRSEIMNRVVSAKELAWAGKTADERIQVAEDLDAERPADNSSIIVDTAVADLMGADLDSARKPFAVARRGLIAWPNSRPIDPVGDLQIVSYRGVPDTIHPPEQPTLLTFDLGELVLPVAVAPDSGPILTVLFHGAIDRSRFELPFFQRYRFQRTLNAGPTAAISDPTLDLLPSLRLGWYLGSEAVELPPIIGEVINRLRDSLGVERVILQGNSGGGFGAIASGVYVENSTVVAFDPQTDLRCYIRRFYLQAVEAATGLPSDSGEELLGETRVNAMARMLAERRFPRIFAASNRGDQIHRDNHLHPLKKFMDEHAPGSFSLIDLDLGPGHNSPSNEVFADVMRRAYDV